MEAVTGQYFFGQTLLHSLSVTCDLSEFQLSPILVLLRTVINLHALASNLNKSYSLSRLNSNAHSSTLVRSHQLTSTRSHQL